MANKFMKVALEEAVIGMTRGWGGPFGAVITKDGKIISRAHNEVLLLKDPTAHAEMNAIRRASKVLDTFDLSDTTLYTTCFPCPMCYGAIKWAGIKEVYFGATANDADKIGFSDKEIYQYLISSAIKFREGFQQIDVSDCLEVFKMWKEKADKQHY
jgi:guanine deaminase